MSETPEWVRRVAPKWSSPDRVRRIPYPVETVPKLPPHILYAIEKALHRARELHPDGTRISHVLDEAEELRQAVADGDDIDHINDELIDVIVTAIRVLMGGDVRP